jgi:hypothetical protein
MFMGGEVRLETYRVKGTNNKVQLLEITVDGRVKVKNLVTHEIFETTKQAFEMAFEPSEYSFLDLEKAKPQARNYQITQSEIDEMIEKAQVEIVELFGKCTLVAVQLANGFILTESATSTDTKNYNKDLNTQICLERIKKRIWELEGYKYQSVLAD